MTTVELGGVTFQEWAESGWVFTDLIGWWSVPSSRAPHDPIPQGHGAFDPGVDWRDGAVPSFKAIYLGNSESDAIAAVESLMALGTSDAQQVLTVTDAIRTTSRNVSVEAISVIDHHGRNEIEIAVDCFAADPLRYGDAVTASAGLPSLAGGITFPITFPITFTSTGDPGRIVLTNEGTQESWPQFTVRGGLSNGFSLVAVETGKEIRFEFPLSPTDEVTVDPRSGQAWINDPSNAVGGFLTVRDWWSVPPGASRTVQFNGLGSVSGSPLLTGVITPAYL